MSSGEDSARMFSELKRFALGDRRTIAGTVYGTIIVMSVLAAGAKSYEHQLWQLLLIAGVTAVVLWLAHVYSRGLGESVNIGRRLTIAELSSIARREYSIVAAAILPLAAVALGVAGVLPPGTAVRVGLWIGVVALAAQGIRYARVERLSRTATIVTVGLNLAIGLGLVALEIWVSHPHAS
jgi:hypothetical protein